MSERPPRRITDADELARAVSGWRGLPVLAFDTEFVHESTFWPRPGLVQIAAAGEVALVDLVELDDLAALAALLAAPETRKVVHAGSGDIALLDRAVGARPRPLFDTQVAAAFCGLGSSLSYAALVAALTGVDLAKSETRTDWTRRPLTVEQLRYAAEDVEHLLRLHDLLEERLRALGRLAWALEESEALLARDPARDDPELAWTRLRGLERLSVTARRIAAALARWRELEARRLDRPRTFVLRDESLRDIARRQLTDPVQIVKVRGFDPRRHRRFAGEIAEQVAAAVAAAGDPLAAAPPPVPRELERAIAAAVTRRAAELELPAELLLSRRARERLLAGLGDEPLSGRLTGWRREALGAALDAARASADGTGN